VRCLQEGQETKDTGGESTSSSLASRGSTSELGRGRARRAGNGAVGGSGSLGLSIRDLGYDRCSGTRSLGLTIRDLRNDWRSDRRLGGLRLAIRDLGDYRLGRTRSLGLAIGNLGDHWGRAGWLRSLGLSIRDLADDGRTSRGGLWLAVGDLADNWAGSGSLRLAIRDLGHAGRLGNLGLSVADLRGTSALVHRNNEDGNALCTDALAVQIVEGSRQARVPDGGGVGAAAAGECERAIAAERETRSLAGASLYRLVELELVVACNVSLTSSLIAQEAILQAEGQSTSKLAGLETITLP
jgi:hypothetical protein